jgi:hypothetical protein
MLFLFSPRGRGIAPLIERSVVTRTHVLLLLLLRFHGLGANESQPCDGNSSVAPAPVYEAGLTDPSDESVMQYAWYRLVS